MSAHFTTSMPALDIAPFIDASKHLVFICISLINVRLKSEPYPNLRLSSSLASGCCPFISVSFILPSPELSAAATDKCWSQAL